MSIAHAQFERQADKAWERLRTEQQGNKDLEEALKQETQVIENLETQATETLRSMSIALAQFERQAERARERERQRTEQQGNKDLEAALKHATQVIENLEADVKSLRQAQRVQRVSDSEDDKKSDMLETSVADLEAQPAILEVNCVTVLRQSACSEVEFLSSPLCLLCTRLETGRRCF
jgi:predicted RNase H-like nuclease (RuvC/YqgF family)